MTRQRFFFVHIMKTAGTALRRASGESLRRSPFTRPWPLDGPNAAGVLYLSVDCLRERLASRGDQIRIITGHFPLRIY